VLKFRRATPSNSEVISAPLLHFKPIFNLPFKKIVRGAPVPGGGALVRFSHFIASSSSSSTTVGSMPVGV